MTRNIARLLCNSWASCLWGIHSGKIYPGGCHGWCEPSRHLFTRCTALML